MYTITDLTSSTYLESYPPLHPVLYNSVHRILGLPVSEKK